MMKIFIFNGLKKPLKIHKNRRGQIHFIKLHDEGLTFIQSFLQDFLFVPFYYLFFK
jgi:hypothetical protein